MGYTKVSVTVPDEIYKELRDLATQRNMKLSHLVSDAIAEKTRRMKEEALLQKINEIFDDPEVIEEQHRMAEAITENTTVEELPW